jgi:hypothetical protein
MSNGAWQAAFGELSSDVDVLRNEAQRASEFRPRNNTAVNLNELGANTRKVLGFCRINPTVTAMQAVEQVTGAGH